jgi:hypothetical protein
MGSGAVLAILLLTVVHFAAFGLLFWHLAGREALTVFRTGPEDGEGRGGPQALPHDPGGDRDGGVPLPDAAPAPVRLREPGRIAESYPRPPRRPLHPPRTPERAPAVTSSPE